MDSVTLMWALAATVLSGMQMFTGKVIAHNKGSSAFNALMTYAVSGVMAYGVWFYYGSVVPDAWKWIVFFALGSGVLHGIGYIIRIDALHHVDSTLFFPLNKILGPILVCLGGVWWLGESLTGIQMLGIVLSLSVPVLLISNTEHSRQKNLKLGLALVVISTLFTSVSMVMTKQGADLDAQVIFMMMVSQLGASVISLAIYLYQNKPSELLRATFFDINVGLVSGFFAFVSFYALLVAYNLGKISLVYTVHAHYILVPVFLSVWWYKEHIDMRKFAAVVLSCVTITLLFG